MGPTVAQLGKYLPRVELECKRLGAGLGDLGCGKWCVLIFRLKENVFLLCVYVCEYIYF